MAAAFNNVNVYRVIWSYWIFFEGVIIFSRLRELLNQERKMVQSETVVACFTLGFCQWHLFSEKPKKQWENHSRKNSANLFTGKSQPWSWYTFLSFYLWFQWNSFHANFTNKILDMFLLILKLIIESNSRL